MQRTLIALITTSLLLAGCMHGDDDGTDDDGAGMGNGGDGFTPQDDNVTLTFDVSLESPAANITAGENTTISWTVDVNGTNDTVSLDETGIAWSATGIENDTDPTSLESKVTVGGNVSAPSGFSVDVAFETEGNLTLRAYSIHEGNVTWSDTIDILVERAGETHTVTIEAAAVANAASIDPDEITITVGDSVVWQNDDDEAHRLKSDADGGSFDTGDIAGGESSDPVTFDVAGTYEYVCTMHQDVGLGHKGTIIVEEA
ncbi:MAG: hypothetical protein KY455_11015 [Euryarchaeota archaeon]|nr:hypothetical protein [Euryarchaeota archaeon]